jgi:hypothetical protein
MSYPCAAGRTFLTLRALFVFAIFSIATFTSSQAALGQTPTQFDQVSCNGTAPPGSPTTDLLVNGPCTVQGGNGVVAEYVFHNVNIVASGNLSFDDARIDFHAESIIVENGGKLTAGTVMQPIGTNPGIQGETGARVRIYLWGPASDTGAACASQFCGVPADLWGSNTTLAMHMVPTPKNLHCIKASSINPNYKLPGDDCFYGYDALDTQDAGQPKYFGHKVLALSYGGTIQMFGTKGASYDTQVDGDPSNTGTSWVRLAGVSSGGTTLTLSTLVPTWGVGDHIMVTTTDYMPTHNEEAVIAQVTGRTVVLKNPLQWQHNASQFMLPASTPSSIGPRGSGSVDTRAAVGLLTRSIEVLSEGNTPDTDPSEHDHFPPTPGNYFGGHTIIRQGFTNYQIKGVEFYRLGQGGLIGHYAVHFHMARKTPQPVDPTQAPYFKDSSIHESMTRWITVHATQGMTFARNVGFQSIGHGFYLEDATEVNNKLYANLGASVIPGVQNAILNPRNVPGILARPNDGPTGSFMPYRSDWNHPTTFWMMNGWNDFQYNMAAGVTACGACYWLLPGANGGPSMFETWDGYASEQLDVLEASPLRMNNLGRAGLTPLKSFIGNSCVAAANSFISIGEINDCIGFTDGSWVDTTLQAVPNPLAPPLPPNQPTAAFLLYYPQLTGLRTPTLCPGADDPNQSVDCSNGASPPLNPCSGGTPSDTSTCAVTVLDHYTTSFNYAQTNFTAIWMRPKWFLVTDSAITDIQYGGLNFVTGGGYTRSDSPVGNWMVAYRNVFIGTSQPVDANGMPANGYASNAGPFNPTSGLTCDNKDFDFCLSSNNGISMQLTPFPGERLFSIYDGPVYQDSNAYLDVYPTIMSGSGWMYKDRVQGVPMDANGECYLPNAAIAWKQPNGFFYPPAFHSENLMFLDANIRHFVIEPLLLPGTFQTDVNAVKKRYCPGNWNPALFEGFTDIDRQTVLNDGVPDLPGIPGGSGSLTGKVGTEVSPDPTQGRETISVNLDDFFNAPVEVPECGSDMHKSALNGQGLPATAKVSPYEYVTTGMIAKCAIGFNGPNPNECVQPDGTIRWSQPCGNEFCFGVPLYRQLLTDTEWTENPKPEPFVKMMGQGTGQRSTLTLNHGHYYVDTTNNCAHQTPPLWNGSCPLQDNYQTRKYNVSVFLPNTTYYLYFLYAKASTQLTYDIYVGTNASEAPTVTGVRGIFPDANYVFNDVASAPWLADSYNKDTGLLTVTVDLSKSAIAQEMSTNFPDFCQPQSYCAIKPSRIGGVPVCGCKSGTDCKDDSVCSWGPKDIDCPEEGCYGFSFTMPSSFQVPFEPLPPPAATQFSSETYFATGNVQFKNVNMSQFGQDSQCQYTGTPTR